MFCVWERTNKFPYKDLTLFRELLFLKNIRVYVYRYVPLADTDTNTNTTDRKSTFNVFQLVIKRVTFRFLYKDFLYVCFRFSFRAFPSMSTFSCIVYLYFGKSLPNHQAFINETKQHTHFYLTTINNQIIMQNVNSS